MILLIDNYDSFTWNLVQRLGELDPSLEPGRDLIVARNDRITPDEAEALDDGRGPTHLIVSPGPCTPAEAGVSGAMIRRFEGRVPILGVCLGFQTMAANDGLPVLRHALPVHGKTSPIHHDGKGIFGGIASPTPATRYHSLVVPIDSVPKAASDGWEISAWTTDTLIDSDGTPREHTVLMGFRRAWSDRNRAPVEGVQFHPESFMTEAGPQMLANFLRMRPSAAG